MDNESYLISLQERAVDHDYDAMIELVEVFEKGLYGMSVDLERAQYWRKVSEEISGTHEQREDSDKVVAQQPQYQDIKWADMEELKDVPLIMLWEEQRQGNPYAMVLLGWQYIESDNSNDQSQATQGADMLKQAIEVGKKSISEYKNLLAEAYWRLGSYYERCADKGVDNLYNKAFECYATVVQELEDDRAVADLARCYGNGLGCERNETMARALMERDANVGGIQERFQLAESYYNEKLWTMATVWYQSALESNNVQTQPATASACKYRLAVLNETDAGGVYFDEWEERKKLVEMAENHNAFAAWFCANSLAETEDEKVYFLELGQNVLKDSYAQQCSKELELIHAEKELLRQEEERERLEEERLRQEQEWEEEERKEEAEKIRSEIAGKILRILIGLLGVIIGILGVVLIFQAYFAPANSWGFKYVMGLGLIAVGSVALWRGF